MLYINVNKENMLEGNYMAFNEEKNVPIVKLKDLQHETLLNKYTCVYD